MTKLLNSNLLVVILGILFVTAAHADVKPTADLINHRLFKMDVRFGDNQVGTCSGLALGGNLILTAAHCLNHYPLVTNISVAYGPNAWFFGGKITNLGGDGLDLLLMDKQGGTNEPQFAIAATIDELVTQIENVKANNGCISLQGRYSGQKCYKISAIDKNKLALVLDGTLIPGDSGGPVWIENGMIVGVIKGGNDKQALIRLFATDLVTRFNFTYP